ncbi:hypothetical protein QO006_003809 [Deinococcus enclensis]|jgi:hypothetical protein|uniref:Uncharacterized protein n=1 Tax=Deinococcus enclensis TaxID=1049582 RepID=A0ABT9MIP6_9DEIO|nr:hypothetical protein [Deinococcus enclensis]
MTVLLACAAIAASLALASRQRKPKMQRLPARTRRLRRA